ncbi:hypothetical protein P280DRAFT_503369 [Massarina eburnea CBS 473.64]|uniref:Uncharacterized protein n=1 Tax=Massarina eburnea CBS 473.64 TaxID=1395130 RepID=A0A6A6SGJ8_9PLEO|nr:hypothetical protein P280DRAFT_503369 [Massarina eburnea CBS 473.64]
MADSDHTILTPSSTNSADCTPPQATASMDSPIQGKVPAHAAAQLADAGLSTAEVCTPQQSSLSDNHSDSSARLPYIGGSSERYCPCPLSVASPAPIPSFPAASPFKNRSQYPSQHEYMLARYGPLYPRSYSPTEIPHDSPTKSEIDAMLEVVHQKVLAKKAMRQADKMTPARAEATHNTPQSLAGSVEQHTLEFVLLSLNTPYVPFSLNKVSGLETQESKMRNPSPLAIPASTSSILKVGSIAHAAATLGLDPDARHEYASVDEVFQRRTQTPPYPQSDYFQAYSTISAWRYGKGSKIPYLEPKVADNGGKDGGADEASKTDSGDAPVPTLSQGSKPAGVAIRASGVGSKPNMSKAEGYVNAWGAGTSYSDEHDRSSLEEDRFYWTRDPPTQHAFTTKVSDGGRHDKQSAESGNKEFPANGNGNSIAADEAFATANNNDGSTTTNRWSPRDPRPAEKTHDNLREETIKDHDNNCLCGPCELQGKGNFDPAAPPGQVNKIQWRFGLDGENSSPGWNGPREAKHTNFWDGGNGDGKTAEHEEARGWSDNPFSSWDNGNRDGKARGENEEAHGGCGSISYSKYVKSQNDGKCDPSQQPLVTKDTPKKLAITYWATVECGDHIAHIPIKPENVTGPEKAIINSGMKKVWKWVQDMDLGDKVTLDDAFDLAREMDNGKMEDLEESKQNGKSKKKSGKKQDKKTRAAEEPEDDHVPITHNRPYLKSPVWGLDGTGSPSVSASDDYYPVRYGPRAPWNSGGNGGGFYLLFYYKYFIMFARSPVSLLSYPSYYPVSKDLTMSLPHRPDSTASMPTETNTATPPTNIDGRQVRRCVFNVYQSETFLIAMAIFALCDDEGTRPRYQDRQLCRLGRILDENQENFPLIVDTNSRLNRFLEETFDLAKSCYDIRPEIHHCNYRDWLHPLPFAGLFIRPGDINGDGVYVGPRQLAQEYPINPEFLSSLGDVSDSVEYVFQQSTSGLWELASDDNSAGTSRASGEYEDASTGHGSFVFATVIVAVAVVAFVVAVVTVMATVAVFAVVTVVSDRRKRRGHASRVDGVFSSTAGFHGGKHGCWA